MQGFVREEMKSECNVAEKGRNCIKKLTFSHEGVRTHLVQPKSHSGLRSQYFLHLAERSYTRCMNQDHHHTSTGNWMYFCNFLQTTSYAGDLSVRKHSLASAWTHWWHIEALTLMVLNSNWNCLSFSLISSAFDESTSPFTWIHWELYHFEMRAFWWRGSGGTRIVNWFALVFKDKDTVLSWAGYTTATNGWLTLALLKWTKCYYKTVKALL